VHPEHQSRPAHGWFPKTQKTGLKATSGRKRLNIQGAIDLETFQFTFVEGEKINAQTTQQMLAKLERSNPTKATIHVFLDNPCFPRQCSVSSRQNIATMVGQSATPGQATLSAAICTPSKPDRAPLGRYAQMGHPQSPLRYV
jgi:hypothetical protein